MTMSRSYSVNVATLKAKLSEYLRLVIKGHSVVILDRKHPIAKLSSLPKEGPNVLYSIKPVGNPNLSAFDFGKPVERHQEINSTELLMKDRKKR